MVEWLGGGTGTHILWGLTDTMYSLTDTDVVFLRGPEANDGVGDRGSVDWGRTSYYSQYHGVLHAVVASGKKISKRFRTHIISNKGYYLFQLL